MKQKKRLILVLGVDDFAIKKGHTYNTGIHNLKGESMLDLLSGRKLEDLRSYAKGTGYVWRWPKDCLGKTATESMTSLTR